MENQMFRKRLFSVSCYHNGIQSGLLISRLWIVHTTSGPYSLKIPLVMALSGTGLLYLNFLGSYGAGQSFFPKSFWEICFISNYLHPKETLGVKSRSLLSCTLSECWWHIEISLKSPQGTVFLLRSGVSMFPIFCSAR